MGGGPDTDDIGGPPICWGGPMVGSDVGTLNIGGPETEGMFSFLECYAGRFGYRNNKQTPTTLYFI